jgi:hypothetical protein
MGLLSRSLLGHFFKDLVAVFLCPTVTICTDCVLM